jgi:hypothetical protein
VGPEGEITIAKLDIAALLALVAALISGIGDVVRQRSAQEITDEEVGHVELLRMSLRDARWWLGGGAAVASAALQAVALGLGSVVLVQALQVTALLFALPVYAWLTKKGLTRREWGWAVLLAGAVAVFVMVGEPAAGYQRASPQTWAVVAVVIGPAMAFCVLGARVWSGPVAAVLGVTVLGETLDADGPELIVLVAAVAVVIVATTALARGEAASMAPGEDRQFTGGRLTMAAPDAASPVAVGATSRA